MGLVPQRQASSEEKNAEPCQEPYRPYPRPARPLRGPARMLFRSYARTYYQPGLCRDVGVERFAAVATASGVSTQQTAERHGFEKAVTGADAVIDDPDVNMVVIATPHDVHTSLTSEALSAGRDVWCEKPLALTCEDLDEVEKAWRGSGRQLTLGFNRGWAPAVQAARQVLAEVRAPKLIVYRVAAAGSPEAPGISTGARADACSARCATSSTSRRRSRAPTSRTRSAC